MSILGALSLLCGSSLECIIFSPSYKDLGLWEVFLYSNLTTEDVDHNTDC